MSSPGPPPWHGRLPHSLWCGPLLSIFLYPAHLPVLSPWRDPVLSCHFAHCFLCFLGDEIVSEAHPGHISWSALGWITPPVGAQLIDALLATVPPWMRRFKYFKEKVGSRFPSRPLVLFRSCDDTLLFSRFSTDCFLWCFLLPEFGRFSIKCCISVCTLRAQWCREG